MSLNKREHPLYQFYEQAFEAVDPLAFFKGDLNFKDGVLHYKESKFEIKGDVYLLSFGKASLKMAQAFVENTKGIPLQKGFIVSHYEKEDIDYSFPKSCTILHSSHPKFSIKSVEAGKRVYEELTNLKKEDLVVCMVSGGGSAMMALPREEVSINEKLDFLNLMLFSGVGEREINVLRKALSKIKGGRLADRFSPARVLNFIVSDERAHKLTAIASGPTLCNNDDPLPMEVIEEFKLQDKVPEKILELFKKTVVGKPHGSLPRIDSFLVATRELLVERLEKLNPFEDFLYIGSVGPKNAKEEKKSLIKKFRDFHQKSQAKSGLMLACGELPIVPVPGSKGGRNQHFALEVLEFLKDDFSYQFLGIATDGCDYLSGVHGSLVSDQDFCRAKEKNLDLKSYIGETNSFEFHEELQTLIKGGYSGTNVSDFFLFSFQKS